MVIKYPELIERHRQQKPDILLANNPPRILGIGIILTALLLGILVAILRSIEYQDTVPIILTLKTAPPHHSLYGEGKLQQQDLMKVHTDQVVLIDLQPYHEPGAGPLRLKVNEISAACNNSQYVIRVDVPPRIATLPSIASVISGERRLNGNIVIQKYSVYDKLFKNLLASLGRS